MKYHLLAEKEVSGESGSMRFAAHIVKYFKPGDTILLYGDLGTGKTFITRVFAKMLGSNTDVTSPSFSLINQYEGQIPINHVDLYRIKSPSELINLGLDDLLSGSGINFIEWPDIIENHVYWHHYRLYIYADPVNMKRRRFKFLEYDE
ncbi:MAG: tRNA (adenosine(37)-N6)-threonylcarbamoyltransferase complex ATPase subunit type 1 TsaE [Calditrichales bacterium]|nr:MAG: tRNA (adenosine(37)-N6)-threonylcarbamoyltransferase complex ATPase subunit type 1 TsaE [Calditrichales bacterium]